MLFLILGWMNTWNTSAVNKLHYKCKINCPQVFSWTSFDVQFLWAFTPIKICLSWKARTAEAKHYQRKLLGKTHLCKPRTVLGTLSLQLILKILVFQSCHQPQYTLQILEKNLIRDTDAKNKSKFPLILIKYCFALIWETSVLSNISFHCVNGQWSVWLFQRATNIQVQKGFNFETVRANLSKILMF